MEQDDKRALFLSLLMVVVLAISSYWNISRARRDRAVETNIFDESGLIDVYSEFSELKNLSNEKIEEMMREYGLGLDSLSEPDLFEYSRHPVTNKLSFEYPSHWVLNEAGADDGDEFIKILFYVQSQGIMNPNIIVVANLEIEKIEDAIPLVKRTFEADGFSIEILEEEVSSEEAYWSARYRSVENITSISREKIVVVDDSFYLFSIIVESSTVSSLTEQLDYIINSIQIDE